MNKRNKIVFLLSLVVITLSIILIIIVPSSKADSGWDNSYSSSSDSSWSSSSNWSSSDSRSSSSSSREGGLLATDEFKIVGAIISIFVYISLSSVIFSTIKEKKIIKTFMIVRTIILIILNILNLIIIPGIAFGYILFALYFDIFYLVYLVINHSNKDIMFNEKKIVEKEKFLEYGLEEETTKKQLSQIFIDVQNAWMNFDYDSLQKLCSDELYNSYKSDLEVLKKKHGKNIMSNFEILDSSIIDISENKNNISIIFILSISFHDYVINEKTQKVVRGSKNRIYNNKYYLEFIKSKNVQSNNCPNCGGVIQNNRCQNCHSKVQSSYNKFVLNTKKILP